MNHRRWRAGGRRFAFGWLINVPFPSALLHPCLARADKPGRPISRYQQWARTVKLPREGGYRWSDSRLYGHHRRKSDSARELRLARDAGRLAGRREGGTVHILLS